MKKDDSIRIRLSKRLKREVKQLADQRDLDMSDIARIALREYLDKRGILLNENPIIIPERPPTKKAVRYRVGRGKHRAKPGKSSQGDPRSNAE